MNKIFEALASAPRRKILAYLAEVDLTAGEIAARFDMSKPAISKHLQILENAGLVTSEKRGQFVHYALVRENLAKPLPKRNMDIQNDLFGEKGAFPLTEITILSVANAEWKTKYAPFQDAVKAATAARTQNGKETAP